MVSFVHKEILNHWQFKKHVDLSSIHSVIGSNVFFHDRLIERWLRMCTFEVIANDNASSLNDLQSDGRTNIQEALNAEENVYIIFDNEVCDMNEPCNLNVYIYDGNFLRDSFKEQLFMKSEDIEATVYFLCTNETYVGENCHARSIMVKRICPYKNVIDRMCDTTEKFNYFNTAGGLVINREVDRMLNGVKTFKDDCWLAFTFFMAPFSQVFTPSNELFSNEFISMTECNPCKKENMSYEKNLMFVQMEM